MKQLIYSSPVSLENVPFSNSINGGQQLVEDRFYEKMKVLVQNLEEEQMKVVGQQNTNSDKFDNKKKVSQGIKFAFSLVKLMTCLDFIYQHKHMGLSHNQQIQKQIQEMVEELKRSIKVRESMNIIEQKIRMLEEKDSFQEKQPSIEENICLENECHKIKVEAVPYSQNNQIDQMSRPNENHISYTTYQPNMNYQFYPYQYSFNQASNTSSNNQSNLNMFYSLDQVPNYTTNQFSNLNQNQNFLYPNGYFFVYPQQNHCVAYENLNNTIYSNPYQNSYVPVYQILNQQTYQYQDHQNSHQQQRNQ